MSEQVLIVEETNYRFKKTINENGQDKNTGETGEVSKEQESEQGRQHFSKKECREVVKAALEELFKRAREFCEEQRSGREINLPSFVEDALESKTNPKGSIGHIKAGLDHYERCKELHFGALNLLEKRIIAFYNLYVDEVRSFNETYHLGEEPDVRIIAFGIRM